MPLTLLALSGCTWITNYDRNERYLEAEVASKVMIPDGLDQPSFVDALQIPEIDDVHNLSGQKLVVGLPEAINTIDVEQIVIKKLGDSRWIFLDETPATVWPKIQRFFDENNLQVQQADPRLGIIESTWLISIQGEASEVYESLVSGTAWTDSAATVQNKLKLTIESGIRSGSSEVYLEHRQVALDSPVDANSVDWNGRSDDLDLEAEILTKLAYFLGENINEMVISVGATALRQEKAELILDSIKPVLRYRLEFNRAWATVGDALENARIEVEDMDRTSAVYYVYFDESVKPEPGFFSRLFFRNKDTAASQENRFQVRLDTQEGEVWVTVLKDQETPADALVAEHLLKIIKESST